MESIKVECSILIRKPAAEIFPYFLEPAKLKQFWLAKAEGPLKVGHSVRWEFMVPGATVQTKATEIVPGKKLSWEWPGESQVTIEYQPVTEGTRVHLIQKGFNASSQSIATAIESTQGFTIVLCDLKTLLETGKSANLVKDKAALIQLNN